MRKDSTWISSLRPKALLAIGNGRTRDTGATRPALAQAIVDTIAAPLLVLDDSLRVVAANPAYTLMFGGDRGPVEGLPVQALGGGLWNIPGLLALLANVADHDGVPETYEVEQDFPPVGRRTMLLEARKMIHRSGSDASILVAIDDITDQRARERTLTQILEQKDILLHEVHHRVANSLQIIASILLVKARTTDSVESRIHLRDSHKRIMSVAATQRHLQTADAGEAIELGPYLSRLCETLTTAVIDDIRPVCLIVDVAEGTVSSSDAASIGLIVTELVINALKHGIPGDRAGGRIVVTYEVAEPAWRLSVSDNGTGASGFRSGSRARGLGMSIVEALATQLDSRVEVTAAPSGTSVSITHGAFGLLHFAMLRGGLH
jgi:chemotaxis protein methyltransferase CheR